MKIKVTKKFRDKLNTQVDYIAKDKPSAARKFKEEIILRIKGIVNMPYQNRKSIFFDSNEIREFIY
ncbi:MAG: type II toxin-antitoxin system RelE/ParE family toxin [Bacteroidales bacterium]|nr:type II toxin-antitoxin system RelE/ParE family toxin [Bacteroidales bacterium]